MAQTAPKRQIIALGGGGFSMEADNLLLDDYVLRASGKEAPHVCFLGTASYDSAGYIERFFRYVGALTPNTSHLPLWKEKNVPERERRDPRAHLLAQDVIYVGGGNTMNMVKLWREMGVDGALREAYDKGVVMAGISAGSICWFEQALTDSIPGKLTPMNFLGWLPGSNCVHYDGEADRRPQYVAAVASASMEPGIACDDGVAAHFVDEKRVRVVSSRPGARAYQVRLDGEEPIVPEYLGTKTFKHRFPIIRRAVAADAAGILAAHHESVRTIASKDYSAEQVAAWTAKTLADDSTKRDFLWQIANEWMWVVEAESKIEGYMHMRPLKEQPDAAYLHAIYLTPVVAGRGVGRRMVDLAEDLAREKQCQQIALHASKSARKFYTRAGFTEAGPEILHTVNGTGLPCFPMLKKL